MLVGDSRCPISCPAARRTGSLPEAPGSELLDLAESEQLQPRRKPVTAALGLLPLGFFVAAGLAAEEVTELQEVVVTAPSADPLRVGARTLTPAQIAPQRARTSDTASLLTAIPGVSVYGAGGVSSLPSIRGLADDRLRTKVDGVDLVASCPNHMNSPLSYIDPTAVESIQVYAGVTPVSVGGDSIGGSILVQSAAPAFAEPGTQLTTGSAGAFYRSNGNSWGGNLSGTYATERLSMNYTGAYAQSDNYRAGSDFKDYSFTGRLGHTLPLDEVGSTAYETTNQSVTAAWQDAGHLLDLSYSYQHIPYENYPNQRMDMTDNRSDQFNLGYSGDLTWGTLTARAYYEHTQHQMDFGDDKRFWYGPGQPPRGSGGDVALNGTPCSPIAGVSMSGGMMVGCAAGMPMDTDGKNGGFSVSADMPLTNGDLVRVGGDYQNYRLDDYWSPSGAGMWPYTFLNINDGRRDRYAVFGEWEIYKERWAHILGVRFEYLDMDAGPVHGYNLSDRADRRDRRSRQPDPGRGTVQYPVPGQDRPQLGSVVDRPFHAGRDAALRDRAGPEDPLAQSVRALHLVDLADGRVHEQLRRRRQRLCRRPRTSIRRSRAPSASPRTGTMPTPRRGASRSRRTSPTCRTTSMPCNGIPRPTHPAACRWSTTSPYSST